MKRIAVFVGAIVAVISMSSSETMAKSSYLDAVNGTCMTAYDCDLCHANGSNKTAYLASGACYFCPTAEACTAPPPAITCTDADGDGFFAEPQCAQLYDCNDRNSSMYPGATEVCNDGIDQDCSGADRKKGKGCRSRK